MGKNKEKKAAYSQVSHQRLYNDLECLLRLERLLKDKDTHIEIRHDTRPEESVFIPRQCPWMVCYKKAMLAAADAQITQIKEYLCIGESILNDGICIN